ncbi:hypothetical protein [Sanyastnella coralliicola]|uniref:hypothetical protein n=1 Tax=Sanyastnella coralliicola TaxID=3069118 RepID=UPI0027BA2F9B|nr:hypothetical protein [Longitalea sp. SCSIO 12813]
MRFLWIKKHWRNTVYSNVWIALGAGLATWQTTAIIGLSDSYLPWFVGISTLFTYNFQRLVKLNDRPEYITAGRNNWLFRNRVTLRVITALCALILLGLVWTLSPLTFLWLAIGGTLSLAYVVRLFSDSKSKKALRDLPFIKIYLIGLVWAMATVILPIIEQDNELWQVDRLFLIIERFAFIIAITVPFEIRDMNLDRPNMKTPAQLFGINGAKLYGLFWIVVAGTVITLNFSDGVYTSYQLIALWFSLILSAVLIAASNPERDEMYFTGWVDGTIIIQAVAFYLLS